MILPAIRVPQSRHESFVPTFRTVTKRNTLKRELYMLQLLITLAAGVLGFLLTRSFVRRRLRFVDAVHSPIAPIVAGAIATAVAWPAALLPFITFTTALTFGLGTALGTVSGSRAVRDAATAHRRLTP